MIGQYNEFLLNRRTLDDACMVHADKAPELRALNVAISIAALLDASFDAGLYYEAAQRIVRLDENNADGDDIVVLFRDLLYQMLVRKRISAAYQLPCLESEAVDALSRQLFFNESTVYMSECLFRCIVEDLRGIFDIDVIKNTLSDEGIMLRGKKRYAVKMGYTNAYGEDIRVSMLRFDREKLKKLGEMDVVDLCNSVNEEEI